MIECKQLTKTQIKALYDANEQFIYVYKFANGKTYVGQSRKNVKRYGVPGVYKYRHPEMYKEMRNGFFKEILCFTDNDTEADEMEDYYIEQYNSVENGYNRRGGGKSGFRISEETRKKLSESLKGHSVTDEARKKMSEARIGKSLKGAKCPSARTVKLIDTQELTERIYNCIMDILKDYPEFNYKSLYNTLGRSRLYKRRYKLEYADSEHINNVVNADQVTININFYVQNRNSQNS